MLRLPIAHDEALEAKLALENVVEQVAVLACVAVVDLVIYIDISALAPHRTKARVNSLQEHIIEPVPARTASANGHRYSSCITRSDAVELMVSRFLSCSLRLLRLAWTKR